jgi:hypothetical protein
MPSLRDVVAKAHGMAPALAAGDDEVLPDFYAPRHRRWLELPESKRGWSPEAIEHARKVFAGEYVHERGGRISPSAMGSACSREMLFSFASAPKLPGSVQNEDKAESGNFEHLRWQMEGLSLPFLKSAEGWSWNEGLRSGGSMDGLGIDDSLFELKNTAPHLFAAISTGRGTAVNFAKGMVRKHKLQMATYWILDDLRPTPRLSNVGSLVYQDTGSKDVYEIRIRRNAKREEEVHRLFEQLHDWIDLDQLPDMLDGCWKTITTGESPTGPERDVYRRCAYREYCPTAQTVTVKK